MFLIATNFVQVSLYFRIGCCNFLIASLFLIIVVYCCGIVTIQTYILQVKNKMPAPVQITAEQLLREAKERELELVQPVVLNAVQYFY